MSVKLSASQFNKLTMSSLRKGVRGFVMGDCVIMETPYGYITGSGSGGDGKIYEFVSEYTSELINTPPVIVPDEQTEVTISETSITACMGGITRSFPIVCTETKECALQQMDEAALVFELPAEFVQHYRVSSLFCGREMRYNMSKVACAPNGVCASDANAYILCLMDLDAPLKDFDQLRAQIAESVDSPDDSLPLGAKSAGLHYLLPTGILFFDDVPLALKFAKKGDVLYSCFRQDTITYYVEMEDGCLPTLPGLEDESRPLAFTLLHDEAVRLCGSIEKYTNGEEKVVLLNCGGFFGFAIQKIENEHIKTNIAVNLPENFAGVATRKCLAEILKLGGIQRYYLGNYDLLVQVGRTRILLGVNEIVRDEQSNGEVQTLNIRKVGIGNLLLDDAQAIAANNATILGSF